MKRTGNVVITVTTQNGKMAKCKISVKKAPKWVKVTAKKKILKVRKTLQLKKTLSKGSAGAVTFKSSNRKVATVNTKGKVFAKKKGRVIITVRTHNGKKGRITLNITK